MKKYLLAGIAILLPVALTIIVIVFLVDLFTSPFVHLVKIHFVPSGVLPENLVPIVSRLLALIFLCAFIFLLGFVARWFIIKNILSIANKILSRIPLIKTIYRVSRDIIAAFFAVDGKKAFKYPVMIPFPYPPSYELGFQAGEVAEEIQSKVKTPLVSVFAPTAPHPISGFLLFIPEKDVLKIEMTNEEAFKFLVSCGLIHPGMGAKEE